MTEKTPSSSRDGVRPTASSMRAYSSAVRPCCNAVSKVTCISGTRQQLRAAMDGRHLRGTTPARDDREEDLAAILTAHQPFAGVLRMWHQTEDIAASVPNPRDRPQRPVRVGFRRDPPFGVTISQDDLATD